MTRVLTFLTLAVFLAATGCNRASSDFQKEGRYLYYTITQGGGHTSRRDLDSAIALANAAKKNGADEKTMRTLIVYSELAKHWDGSVSGSKYLDACQLDAAIALAIKPPSLRSEPSPGDCEKLIALASTREEYFAACKKRDPELSRLLSREQNGQSDALSRRSSVERAVNLRCAKEADAKLSPN